MKLIVGLGNPGEKYAGNRHNIGFMAVDEIARGYGFAPWKKRFQGYTAEGQIGLEKCILVKPSTYMNESGRAVGEAMRFYKLGSGDVIVVHDEIDLKPGVIRVKKGGGNAGHNGLKSISAHIGNDYVRVRLGIDHPGDKTLVAHYVLQNFTKAEHEWVLPLLEGVARGMPKLVEGSEAAFLAEAARGRKPQAAPKADATPSAKAVEIHASPVLNAPLESASKTPLESLAPPPIVALSALAAEAVREAGPAAVTAHVAETTAHQAVAPELHAAEPIIEDPFAAISAPEKPPAATAPVNADMAEAAPAETLTAAEAAPEEEPATATSEFAAQSLEPAAELLVAVASRHKDGTAAVEAAASAEPVALTHAAPLADTGFAHGSVGETLEAEPLTAPEAAPLVQSETAGAADDVAAGDLVSSPGAEIVPEPSATARPLAAEISQPFSDGGVVVVAAPEAVAHSEEAEAETRPAEDAPAVAARELELMHAQAEEPPLFEPVPQSRAKQTEEARHGAVRDEPTPVRERWTPEPQKTGGGGFFSWLRKLIAGAK